MTNMRNFVALSAMVAIASVSQCVSGQDDLDDLLKDLESENTKVTATEPAKEEKAEAAPVAEESKEAVATAEEPKAEEAEKAEEVAEAKEPEAGEAKEEVAAAEEPKAEEAEKAEEVAEAKEPETEEAKEEVAAAEELKAEEAEDVAEAARAEVAAAGPAKTEAVVPALPSETTELIGNLSATEKLRRKALDKQAQREMAEARQCMLAQEYSDAVRHYDNASKLLNDRTGSKDLRKECDQGVAEGLYRLALQEDELGRRENAVKQMEMALAKRHPKAHRVLTRWRSDGAQVIEKKDLSEIKHRRSDEDYRAGREQIRKHLRRSRQYYALREIDKALEECEVVLASDPYNQEAIRLRGVIEKKRQTIIQQERIGARDGYIADVDEAWRPVSAVNAAKLNERASETLKKETGSDPERTQEQEIEKRMKEMRLPTISFKPPATIMDAVEFFRQASIDYDRPDLEVEKRGFNFVLKTPQGALKQQATEESDDFSASGSEEVSTAGGLDPIPTITASDITFYEALKLVCDSVDYKFIVRGPVVMVMHKDMSTAELLSRKYDVLDAFLERMSSASSDIKEMRQAGFGGGSAKPDNGDESQEKDWKAFFEQMGVKWPEGSSIMYIKTLGKLYVRNTRENLAEFEKLLQEMGSQPKLIEIETRFVEVSQEDLNSLGFEWILNSDYSLNVGNSLGKALGIKRSRWGSESGSTTHGWSSTQTAVNGSIKGSNGAVTPHPDTGTTILNTSTDSQTYQRTWLNNSRGAGLVRDSGSHRTLGINAFGGTSDQQNGTRYLSTESNLISGESQSTNDQFMRVNAFLGSADLSMILHMLSQRSDTDLLSAPKVVTKSGENAVIKVVTEYIYPQDYDVQLQSSSSSSGSSSSGGSQSAILAVVEPQNFTMREVGVILDVTPTYSEANGGTIDLELKPQVVDEPTWRNYGMKIPFTGNASQSNWSLSFPDPPFANMEVPTDLAQDIITKYWNAVANLFDNLAGGGSNNNITYYDAPMEQPFFHVRSIDSKVSITPGSTVVMGGLITEQRKAMDDKIPFLGDLPFIGRLFRSHAEQTTKRNLLIFVTGRLITPSGRELKTNDETVDESEVKAAPQS